MNNSEITIESLFDTECLSPLAAIEIDLPVFNTEFGEGAFTVLRNKLEALDFVYRGTIHDSAIFAYPTPLLDDLLDEFTFAMNHGARASS